MAWLGKVDMSSVYLLYADERYVYCTSHSFIIIITRLSCRNMAPKSCVQGCDIVRGQAKGYITAEDTWRVSHIWYIKG